MNWNLALDEQGGPHLGGCGTCTGLVTTHPDGTVTTNAEYYTIGHLSKFVKPGAVRIASTSFGTTGWNGQIMDVAFRNPDGSTALVVHNENDDPRSFAVSVGSKSFDYTLPGGALATFTWPASAALDDDLAPISHRRRHRHGDERRRRSGPSPSTRMPRPDGRAGKRSRPGSTSRSTSARRRPSAGSRSTRAATSATTRATGSSRHPSTDASWTVIGAGAGVGQLTNVDVAATNARYLRVSSTGSADNWWSIADVRLYG